MNTSKVLKVRPDVLKSLRYYARQQTSMVVEHFEKKSKLKFGVSGKYLKEIESSEHELSLELIKEFASLYKFPLSCFLLPRPLKDDLVPADYRQVPAAQRGSVSPKMALVLRSAQRAQYVISILNEIVSNTLPTIHLHDDIEKIALEARELLDRAFLAQERINNPYQFFNLLRDELEKLGLVVMKTSFPLDDARAFSLTSQKPYVIVVNNKDGTEFGYSPKIFSLLHEFGHVLLRDGGLCSDLSSVSKIEQELFCNAFAAACLIPKSTLYTHLRQKNITAFSNEEKMETIDDLRKKFLVSGEVVIRRIHSLKYISLEERDRLINDWDRYAARYRKSGFIPPLSQSQKCFNKNGKYYTHSVFNGVARGVLTPENAVSYLGIKLKHFKELQGITLH
ncbi:ImmA/IrrE family metallo-endopeptidase [Patescibacteria group bacterium]|nr:ImmA/IrrE family metallo-endopeptidase [Patescibacteria group bacterium]